MQARHPFPELSSSLSFRACVAIWCAASVRRPALTHAPSAETIFAKKQGRFALGGGPQKQKSAARDHAAPVALVLSGGGQRAATCAHARTQICTCK